MIRMLVGFLRGLPGLIQVLLAIAALMYLVNFLGWLKVGAGLALIGFGILVVWGSGSVNESGMRSTSQAFHEREHALEDDLSGIRERGLPYKR